MERLTMRNADGSVSHPANTAVKAIVDRLADYEGTGLTPEEIIRLCSMDRQARMAELLRMDGEKPLTLEQLLEMDREPVWCTFSEESDCPGSCYMIIQWHNSEFFNTYECGFLLIEEYGKTWLAYRRKPEQEDS